MENRFEIQGSCLTVHLPKEVDHPVSDDIRRESDDIMRKQYIRTMVFDFSGTAFMDSSGIGVIMGRYQKLRLLGGSVAATHVSDRIWRILHLAGVTKVLEVEKERNWKENK